MDGACVPRESTVWSSPSRISCRWASIRPLRAETTHARRRVSFRLGAAAAHGANLTTRHTYLKPAPLDEASASLRRLSVFLTLHTAHGTQHATHCQHLRHGPCTQSPGTEGHACAPLVDVLRHVLHEGEGLAQIVVVGVRRVRVLDQILQYIIIKLIISKYLCYNSNLNYINK